MFHVHGCKPEPDSPGNLMKCPDEEATVFSIYETGLDGLEYAVADFPTRELAEKGLADIQAFNPYGGEPMNVLPVQNLAQFSQLMIDWFTDKSAQVGYALTVPDDVKIKATIDGVERPLTNTERQAFLAGVGVVASIFNKLPFEVKEAEDDAETTGNSGV